jgi:competence protein ComEA
MIQLVRMRGVTCAAIVMSVLIALAGASPLAAAQAQPEPAPPPAQPVDLNTADAAALTKIPGIGPATAQRILEWREQNGPFRQVEDLMKVKGIGEKSLEKLRPYVKVTKSK